MRHIGSVKQWKQCHYEATQTRMNSMGFYWQLCLCLLWAWPLTFWPKIQPLHFWTQIHLWQKLGEIPLIGFRDIVFTTFSVGRTHSLTDGQTRIQNVPGTVLTSVWGTKTQITVNKSSQHLATHKWHPFYRASKVSLWSWEKCVTVNEEADNNSVILPETLTTSM